MTTTMTIQDLAREASNAFVQAERPNGEKFTKLEDAAPQWVSDAVKAAHFVDGDWMLPDDWRYTLCERAFDAIADCERTDEIEIEPDIYNFELLNWLRSHAWRFNGYADTALEEIDNDGDFMRVVSYAQSIEQNEVLNILIGQCETELAARESDNETNDEDGDVDG